MPSAPERTIHVLRKGMHESMWTDTYHRFLRVSWPRFFIEILAYYTALNIAFACLYLWLSPAGIAHAGANYWDYFFFSAQTSASLGYGFFYPTDFPAHLIVTVETFCGLISNAVMAGLFFARFSRPIARIIFSENILWAKFQGRPTLMMRMGNMRANRVYEGRARWVMLTDEKSEEGTSLRRLTDLKLVRNDTTLFALSWTLFHVIDESSPFWGKDCTLIGQNTELMVTFSGIDQETAQTLSAHQIYKVSDIVKARSFTDMIRLEGDQREIDFAKIDLYEN